MHQVAVMLSLPNNNIEGRALMDNEVSVYYIPEISSI